MSTGSGLAITTATGFSDVLSDGSCLRSTSPSETGLAEFAVSLPDARLAAGPRALAPKLGAIFIRDLRIAMLILAYDVSFTEKKKKIGFTNLMHTLIIMSHSALSLHNITRQYNEP